MSMANIGYSDITELYKDLTKLANETMPKESKQFLAKEANELKKELQRRLKTAYGVRKGNLVKQVRKGKSYFYKPESAYQTRIYFAPHMNVVDYGHPVKNGGPWVEGKHIKEKTESAFADTFARDVERFIDELLDKGLG